MSEEILKQVLSKLEDIDQKLEHIQAVVYDIPFIKQAVIETSDTVTRIESAQERHEHILEILSLRSVEQEATLKRLR